MEQTQYEKISLINGKIHTQSGVSENITFEHGRIVSIDDEAGSFNGKVIDLHGRTVLQGFCDSGLDFLSWAESQERLNLINIHSVKEFSDSLSAYVQSNPTPLRGWYIAENLPDDVNISRDDIEKIVSSIPCAVTDVKNSHALLNTPAMNELNMPQDSVESGELNQHLPDLTEENIIYLVKNYSQKINALGITELWGDFYGDAKKLWDIFSNDAYESLDFRLRCNFGFNDVGSLNEFLSSGLRTGDGMPFCKFGGILINGNLEQTEQKNMIYSAHLSGCQIISDNNKSCLSALERVTKKVRKSSRHLIKNITSGLFERMRLLGLGGILSSQGENNFIHEAFQNGLVICEGSGKTAESPLKNISNLVLNGLSVAEALSIYTWGASWNSSNEARRGELSVGNDADIVVLEQDPFTVSPEKIANIDVTMTFTAGCAVYDSGEL